MIQMKGEGLSLLDIISKKHFEGNYTGPVLYTYD